MGVFEALFWLLAGSAISAVSGVFWLRYKKRLDDSLQGNRRAEILEEVAAHVGKVNHVFARYAAIVSDASQVKGSLPPRLASEAEAVTQQLVEVFEEISRAESKLALLGEKRLEKALQLYSVRLAYFRKLFTPGVAAGDKDPAEVRKEIARLREQFYDILSERYDTTL